MPRWPPHARRLARAFWSDWRSVMTGGASLVLLFLATAVPSVPPWVIYWTGYLAGLVVFYRLWCRQCQAHDEQLARAEESHRAERAALVEQSRALDFQRQKDIDRLEAELQKLKEGGSQ